MTPDILCLSHVRWDAATGRPQRLTALWAAQARVLFVEPPVSMPGAPPALGARRAAEGVLVLRPELPRGVPASVALPSLLERGLAEHGAFRPLAWCFHAGAVSWLAGLSLSGVVYDREEDSGAPELWDAAFAAAARRLSARGTSPTPTSRAAASPRPACTRRPRSPGPRSWP